MDAATRERGPSIFDAIIVTAAGFLAVVAWQQILKAAERA